MEERSLVVTFDGLIISNSVHDVVGSVKRNDSAITYLLHHPCWLQRRGKTVAGFVYSGGRPSADKNIFP